VSCSGNVKGMWGAFYCELRVWEREEKERVGRLMSEWMCLNILCRRVVSADTLDGNDVRFYITATKVSRL
jgi:hypothetical protein